MMSRRPKLKPCPFCGNTRPVIASITDAETRQRKHRVFCFNNECPASLEGNWGLEKRDAAEAWNTRAAVEEKS